MDISSAVFIGSPFMSNGILGTVYLQSGYDRKYMYELALILGLFCIALPPLPCTEICMYNVTKRTLDSRVHIDQTVRVWALFRDDVNIPTTLYACIYVYKRLGSPQHSLYTCICCTRV